MPNAERERADRARRRGTRPERRARCPRRSAATRRAATRAGAGARSRHRADEVVPRVAEGRESFRRRDRLEPHARAVRITSIEIPRAGLVEPSHRREISARPRRCGGRKPAARARGGRDRRAPPGARPSGTPRESGETSGTAQVERGRLAVGGHLRAVAGVQPAPGHPPDAGERGGVDEHDRVRRVEPQPRSRPSLLDPVGDPRVALELAELDRLPLGIGRRHPARLPVEPVEMDDRDVEDLCELPRRATTCPRLPNRGSRRASPHKDGTRSLSRQGLIARWHVGI